MTQSVVMIANVFDADGVLLAAGSTAEVEDAVAYDLIGTGRASWLVPPEPNPATLTKEEVETVREGGGGVGVITTYTAAQLAAMELAGTLTLNAWYVASDSGAWGLATAVNVIAWIDFDALALAMEEGLATYAAGEIENLAGVPATLPDLLANAQLNCYPRGFVLAASDGMGLPMVAAAAAYVKGTGYVVSNPSGTIMKIDQATGIGHGMGATSEGNYLWIRTSAGVPTGFYEITDRSVADEINVDVGISSGLIGTTVIEAISRVSDYAPIAVVQIPGGVMGPGGKLEFDIAAVCTNSANYKYVRAVVDTDSVGAGGTQAGESGVTTTYGIRPPIPAVMLNTGATNAQVMFGYSTSISGAVPTETIDTDANFYVSLQAKCTAVDEYIRLAWSVNLTPGA